VGLPDPEWGERIVAAVTIRPDATDVDIDHVRDWARERVGSLKAPEEVKVVDELPQTATGKVLRRKVRDDFLAN
jgi:acyl-CoA synthetase (AMP-forming)/AMP-acid ligase II